MFNMGNCPGRSGYDLALMNAALVVLVKRGMTEKTAGKRIRTNWRDYDNTLESLTAAPRARAARRWTGQPTDRAGGA